MPSLEDVGGAPGGSSIRAFLQLMFNDDGSAKGIVPAFQPSDHGFAGWAFDPALVANTTAPTNGTAYFVAIPIRTLTTVSKVWFNIGTAAVTPTAGQNFFGLYSPAGALLASGSADAAVLGTGPISVSIAAQVLQPGIYYACIMVNCATPPTLSRNPGSAAPGNANLSAAAARFFRNTTGNTTALPASIVLASNINDINYWAALS